jgi:hypothetical protein
MSAANSRPRPVAAHYSVAFTLGLFITIALIKLAILGRMLGDIGTTGRSYGLVLIWVALMFG